MGRLPIPALIVAAAALIASSAVPAISASAELGPGASWACALPAHGVALNFAHEFVGVSQEDGESNVWVGRVHGAVSGDLVMTLQLLGSPMEAANPVWNVWTRWLVTPHPGDTTLVAELYGTVNWKTGGMRLSGVVVQGCLKGAEVNADGRFANLDGSGTLEIAPAIALR